MQKIKSVLALALLALTLKAQSNDTNNYAPIKLPKAWVDDRGFLVFAPSDGPLVLSVLVEHNGLIDLSKALQSGWDSASEQVRIVQAMRDADKKEYETLDKIKAEAVPWVIGAVIAGLAGSFLVGYIVGK